MEYWKLFGIGVIITIITTIAIRVYFRTPYALHPEHDYERICQKHPIVMWVLAIPSMVCICLVGGILVAEFLGIFAKDNVPIWGYILIAMMPAFLTYACGGSIMGFDRFQNGLIQILFIIVFIASIIGWTIPITNYNRNIETHTESVLASEENRELFYFCNIPVQKISGNISGSSILGTGSVSGNISTTSELPYWYKADNGTAKYASVPTSNSQIVFIEDGESPYVKIFYWEKRETTINHNNGSESVSVESSWQEYIFYLPKEIMQYNLGG